MVRELVSGQEARPAVTAGQVFLTHGEERAVPQVPSRLQLRRGIPEKPSWHWPMAGAPAGVLGNSAFMKVSPAQEEEIGVQTRERLPKEEVAQLAEASKTDPAGQRI